MHIVMDPTRNAGTAGERRRVLFLLVLSLLIGLATCLSMLTSASAATGQVAASPAAGTATVSQAHSATQGLGYWLVASDGGIFGQGGAPFRGSTGGITLNKPIVDMAATPNGNGYWLVASDGGIFNYGNAAFQGSAGSLPLNKPIVGMAATPDGKGYWLVASDGGIFNYGDAAFYGSTGGMQLNKPIVGMAAAPDGNGYYLVASDGGIFNYGDAAFFGSAGGMQLNKPIVGMAASFDGKGYYLVASDGGIFNYGDATFFGSAGGITLNRPIVGVALSGFSGAASKLAFSTQAAGASGGTAFSTQPTVTIEDAAGDPVTTNASTVTLAIAPGTPGSGGPGTLSTCTSTDESNGVFAFSGCAIDKAGTGYELVATDGGLTGATSAPFTVGVGPATHVAFTTEPSNAIGGSAFVDQPVVTIQDAGGNTVTTDTHAITLAKASGIGSLSGCTATTTAGVASFSGCTINAVGTYSLTATDAADTFSTTSASFDVGTGLASQLAFTTEPAAATGGSAFGTQPTVTIQDAGGNTVTTDTHAITLTKASGTGTLSGCSATTTAGVASFGGCTINTAGAYTLTANDTTDVLSASSSSFNVVVGAASQLAFTAEPAAATGGTAFGTQPTVTIQDAGGNTVATDTNAILLTLTTGPGSLSGCTATTTAGVAAFSDCTINTAATGDILTATDATDSFTATGSPFDVTAGAPAQVAFTSQPGDATGGTAFGTQPTVTIQDAGGNTVGTDTSPITLTLTAGPGTLAGCSATTTAGVAAFNGCRIDTAATGDILTATDSGDSLNDVSNAFDVTVGAPVQLVFTTEPGDAVANTAFGIQPVVTIEDAGGNTVTADGNGITLAISSGAGTLSGCSATTGAGVASFGGCTIDTPGSFILSATDAGETLNGAGTSFVVTP